MQFIEHSFGIGVARFVEYRLAHRDPPEPVLHNIVDGDAKLPIFACHARDLCLCLVAVLALPESIGPLAEHGRSPRELTVSTNDAVELRTIDEVVIDRIGDLRAQV